MFEGKISTAMWTLKFRPFSSSKFDAKRMTNKVAAASTFLSRTNELGYLQQSCIRILSFCESSSSRIGLHIHCPVIKFGLLENLDFCNNLLSLYLKTDGIWNARKLFDEMPQKTVCLDSYDLCFYQESRVCVSAFVVWGNDGFGNIPERIHIFLGD